MDSPAGKLSLPGPSAVVLDALWALLVLPAVGPDASVVPGAGLPVLISATAAVLASAGLQSAAASAPVAADVGRPAVACSPTPTLTVFMYP